MTLSCRLNIFFIPGISTLEKHGIVHGNINANTVLLTEHNSAPGREAFLVDFEISNLVLASPIHNDTRKPLTVELPCQNPVHADATDARSAVRCETHKAGLALAVSL